MSKKTEDNQLKKSILEDAEALADAIENIEQAMLALKGSRLKERAVLILLSNYSQLPQSTVKKVLEALENIRRAYLK